MAAIMRENLACELFGFDPELSKVRMKRASLLSDAKALANVVTGQGNLLKGLTEGAKVALAGRQFMTNVAYTLHFAVEGRSKAGVSENTARLKKLALAEGGKEIENSIPKIIRANPFTPLNNVLGPEGERWVPVHGLVPVSKGAQVWAEIDAAFAVLQPEFDRTGVQTGFLITSLSTTGFLIEPVFLWPEARFALHESTVEPGWLKRLPVHAENPEVTALVARARKAVIDIFVAHGGTHFQIGRAYPYFESRSPVMQQTLGKLKAMLDPHNRINPGVLGLGGEA
jgi:FAD/FMN-containing dehydrogenase